MRERATGGAWPPFLREEGRERVEGKSSESSFGSLLDFDACVSYVHTDFVLVADTRSPATSTLSSIHCCVVI